MDNADNIYVTGAGFISNQGLYHQYYVTIKYDSAGNVIWTRTADGNLPFGIATDGKGYIGVTGLVGPDLDWLTIEYNDPDILSCVLTPSICNAGNACIISTCDAASGKCLNTPIDVDDKDLCTNDICDPATGNISHTPLVCDDKNACTTDICNSATGCVFAPITCNDNNACTTDACNPATGCAFTPLVCDDADVCTTDICDSTLGCMFTPTVCHDGDLDGDSKVSVNDALKALRISLGIITPADSDVAHGDVAPLVSGAPQPDGKIDIGDVVVILRKAVGLW